MKKFLILYLAILLISLSICNAQQWQNFKGIRLVNNSDTTAQLQVQGSLFYDDQIDSLYIFNGTQWVNLMREGSSGIAKAGNGTSIQADSIVLGGTLWQHTTIDNGEFNFYLDGTNGGDIIVGDPINESGFIYKHGNNALTDAIGAIAYGSGGLLAGGLYSDPDGIVTGSSQILLSDFSSGSGIPINISSLDSVNISSGNDLWINSSSNITLDAVDVILEAANAVHFTGRASDPSATAGDMWYNTTNGAFRAFVPSGPSNFLLGNLQNSQVVYATGNSNGQTAGENAFTYDAVNNQINLLSSSGGSFKTQLGSLSSGGLYSGVSITNGGITTSYALQEIRSTESMAIVSGSGGVSSQIILSEGLVTGEAEIHFSRVDAGNLLIIMNDIPTGCGTYPTGTLWNNSGVLSICP